MERPNNDKWERTKQQLFRNVLVNPGFELSPIPEDERSSDSEGSLPELIVERAPVSDPHDHPPAFYDGLERRMKRYYRQLFLGASGSDDESIFDFEVNRTMASTFIEQVEPSKDRIENYKHLSDENVVSINEMELTKSTESRGRVRADINQDKLIDTDATYESSHISIDDSNKSSSVEDEDESDLESIEPPETENDLNLINKDEQNDNEARLKSDDFNIYKHLALEEVENKSISEDSEISEPCHRILTTVAEIHEPPESVVQFDNGSPVLIPRLLQFGRTVFGDMSRYSASVKSLETFGGNNNQLSEHIVEQLNEDVTEEEHRLLSASELTKINIDNTFDTEVVNVIETKNDTFDKRPEISQGKFQVSELESDEDDNVETNQQDKTVETVEHASVDWDEDGIDDDEDCFDNAIRKGVFASKARKFTLESSDEDSFDEYLEPIAHSSKNSLNEESIEVMREAKEPEVNLSWHGETDQATPTLAFEAKTSADKVAEESSESNAIDASREDVEINFEEHSAPNDHSRIIDDFWSVSSIDVDIEQLPNDQSGTDKRGSNKNGTNSRGSNKRRSDSRDDASPKKKNKMDIAIQTPDEKSMWENVFVGKPLIFKLCGCQNHVCS